MKLINFHHYYRYTSKLYKQFEQSNMDIEAEKRIVLETILINKKYAYIVDKVLSLPFNCQLVN